MTHPTEIKIPNDSIITEFKEHLDLEFNQRILFKVLQRLIQERELY